MSPTLNQRALTALAGISLTVFAAACGGSEDAAPASSTSSLASAMTPSTAITTAATQPATTRSRSDVTAFCAAELEAEAAFLAEDPVRIAEANEAAQAAAPADIADAVDALVSSIDDGGPEFDAAYGEVIGFMQQHCGFTQVDVTGGDYHFEGLPASLPAGPAIFTLANNGAELHQLLVVRLGDEVSETAGELAARTEDEVMSQSEPVGAAFASPGSQGYGTMNLTPGRYLALCFIPVGVTPDALEAAGPGGPPTDGPSHASQGMVAEFEVS